MFLETKLMNFVMTHGLEAPTLPVCKSVYLSFTRHTWLHCARVCVCVRCVCVCVRVCSVRVCARIHVINEHSVNKVFGAKHTFINMLQSSLDNGVKTHVTIVFGIGCFAFRIIIFLGHLGIVFTKIRSDRQWVRYSVRSRVSNRNSVSVSVSVFSRNNWRLS